MKTLALGMLLGLGLVSSAALAPTQPVPKLTESKVEASVRGAEQADVGSLVVLKPENVTDARTIWDINYPERFEEFAEENGKLFIAMPNETVSFTLLVVPNDVNQPLQKIRHTIEVGGGSIKPEEPTDPPKSPEGDWKSSPMVSVTKSAYQKVQDSEKTKWAKQMSNAFLYVADKVDEGAYTSTTAMMEDVRKANRGELGDGETWPDTSRSKWVEFRAAIAAGLDTLEAQDQLKDIKSYAKHWRAIAYALKEEGGF